MSNGRRNFCKNSVYIGLGLSFFPVITHAKENQSFNKNVLCLKKNAQKTVIVSGQIRNQDLSPVKNAVLEIWHTNTKNSPSKFQYEGKLITDSEGRYQFETDFPDKHFEEGDYKMRRIFFKIKQKNGEETFTKLYFGANRKAFVDGLHVENTHQNLKAELPKTKHENDDLSIIQFNIYLNS